MRIVIVVVLANRGAVSGLLVWISERCKGTQPARTRRRARRLSFVLIRLGVTDGARRASIQHLRQAARYSIALCRGQAACLTCQPPPDTMGP